MQIIFELIERWLFKTQNLVISSLLTVIMDDETLFSVDEIDCLGKSTILQGMIYRSS